MSEWRLNIDQDFIRLGLNPEELETDGITVERAERLSATAAALTVVVTLVGGKILEYITEESIKAAFKRLMAFARGKERRLRIEIEDKQFDPRIKLLAARLETMDDNELDLAIKSLPTVRRQSERLLDSVDENLNDAWYVWNDGRWTFSYYTSESGELVDDLEGAPEQPAAITDARK